MKKRTIFYKKLMLSYNVIIFSFIFVINLVLFRNIEQRDISYNQQINKRIVNNISEKFEDMETFISNFITELYGNSNIIEDTIFFLNSDLNTYLQNKLDKFYESDDSYYKGIEYLVRNSFERSSLIESIELVSYKNKTSYLFNRENKIKEKKYSDIEMNETFLQSSDNEDEEILYIRNINNPLNLQTEGIVVFKFNKSEIYKIIQNYDEIFRILILKQNGLILYDSKKISLEQETDFIDITKILNTHQDNITIDELSNDIVILGIVQDIPFVIKNKQFIVYIILINIIFFIASEIFIFKRLKKLNNRLSIILDTMESININTNNKLNRIPKEVQSEKDEISIICENFNKMCDNLEEYIDKFYISQINEKNAEMKTLQSSINPHFLYNTLESIRMKAIINNDKEVARMIYMLAHIFRSQLKEKDMIKIKSELEYCDKFLQIYKFRYSNKILYSVECEEDLLDKKIIKFIIQPLIENYFIHGIRLESNDNILKIRIKKISNIINIVIEDNGKGIPIERLNILKQKIKNQKNDDQMVGILNVNQRIKIKYGNEYGVDLESEEGEGTKITIKLPYIDERS